MPRLDVVSELPGLGTQGQAQLVLLVGEERRPMRVIDREGAQRISGSRLSGDARLLDGGVKLLALLSGQDRAHEPLTTTVSAPSSASVSRARTFVT